MHKQYENIFKHKADFLVKYKFFSCEEGGRETLPFQGIKSDFWYQTSEFEEKDNLFMIYPEFLDENGKVILENSISVPKEGFAKMWILMPEKRKFHRENIKVGTIGYFREGSKETAIAEVVEIIGLFENPDTN